MNIIFAQFGFSHLNGKLDNTEQKQKIQNQKKELWISMCRGKRQLDCKELKH